MQDVTFRKRMKVFDGLAFHTVFDVGSFWDKKIKKENMKIVHYFA